MKDICRGNQNYCKNQWPLQNWCLCNRIKSRV